MWRLAPENKLASVINYDQFTVVEIEKNQDCDASPTQPVLKEGSRGWIIAGFILTILGGALGLVIGFNYAFGYYNKRTKKLGWAMILLFALLFVVLPISILSWVG